MCAAHAVALRGTTRHSVAYRTKAYRTKPYGRFSYCQLPYVIVCLGVSKKRTLSRADWIDAAFGALTDVGAQALKVEGLARALKVSKGSFYWHFKDVNDLKRAMVRHWQSRACDAVEAEINRTAQAPPAALSRLLALSVAPHWALFGDAATEAAMRDWARYDAAAGRAIAAVDAKRVAFLAGLLRQYGLPEPEAAQKARLLYAAVIGRDALSLAGMDKGQDDLHLLLACLLAA